MVSARFRPIAGLFAAACLVVGTHAAAEDWPNWRGPRHDGISRESIRKSWPAEGPKVVWKRDLTGGYSTFAVAGGRLYTMTEDQKQEIVLCLDANTGETVWEYRYAADYDKHPQLDQRFKGGPRSSPTLDGDCLYTIGTLGMLHCIDVKTGKPVWQADLLQMAGRTAPEFGYTHSPLISGDLLFVHPGGTKGNSLAALNRRDGSVVWKAEDDPIGYSTPVAIEHGGTQQVVFFTARGLVAVTPKEGKVLWRFDWKTNYDLNVATPIFANDQVFLSSNYGRGAALVRLKAGANPEEVYRSAEMQNHFSTCVLWQGHLYGFSNDRLRCMELATGQVKWDQRGFGRGSLVLADGHLIILGENGQLALAEATPAAYTEKAAPKAMLQGPCWNVPVLSNGKLYLRSENLLLAVDMTPQ